MSSSLGQTPGPEGNEEGRAASQQPGYILQAAAALRRRTRRALSPWIQNRLQQRAKKGADRVSPRQTALAVGNARSILARVQRAADQTRVWNPRSGPLQPARVQSFSRSVAGRQRAIQPIGLKAQVRSAEPGPGADLEMTLPGAASPGQASGELSAGSRISAPGTLSAGARIAPFSPTTPTSPPSAPTFRPSAPVSRPPDSPVRRTPSPGARRFTRVEEISAAGTIVSGAPIPPEAPAKEEQKARRPEPPPAAREPGDIAPPVESPSPPSPPQIRRQAAPKGVRDAGQEPTPVPPKPEHPLDEDMPVRRRREQTEPMPDLSGEESTPPSDPMISAEPPVTEPEPETVLERPRPSTEQVQAKDPQEPPDRRLEQETKAGRTVETAPIQREMPDMPARPETTPPVNQLATPVFQQDEAPTTAPAAPIKQQGERQPPEPAAREPEASSPPPQRDDPAQPPAIQRQAEKVSQPDVADEFLPETEESKDLPLRTSPRAQVTPSLEQGLPSTQDRSEPESPRSPDRTPIQRQAEDTRSDPSAPQGEPATDSVSHGVGDSPLMHQTPEETPPPSSGEESPSRSADEGPEPHRGTEPPTIQRAAGDTPSGLGTPAMEPVPDRGPLTDPQEPGQVEAPVMEAGSKPPDPVDSSSIQRRETAAPPPVPPHQAPETHRVAEPGLVSDAPPDMPLRVPVREEPQTPARPDTAGPPPEPEKAQPIGKDTIVPAAEAPSVQRLTEDAAPEPSRPVEMEPVEAAKAPDMPLRAPAREESERPARPDAAGPPPEPEKAQPIGKDATIPAAEAPPIERLAESTAPEPSRPVEIEPIEGEKASDMPLRAPLHTEPPGEAPEPIPTPAKISEPIKPAEPPAIRRESPDALLQRAAPDSKLEEPPASQQESLPEPHRAQEVLPTTEAEAVIVPPAEGPAPILSADSGSVEAGSIQRQEAPDQTLGPPPGMEQGVLSRAISRARLSLSRLTRPSVQRRGLIERQAARPPTINQLSSMRAFGRLRLAPAMHPSSGWPGQARPALSTGPASPLSPPPADDRLEPPLSLPQESGALILSSLPGPTTPSTGPQPRGAAPVQRSQEQEIPLPLAVPRAVPTPEEEPATTEVDSSTPVYSTESSAPSGAVSVIQRAADDLEDEEEVDLSELAQRIYPLIRRMLSIERERALGRRA